MRAVKKIVKINEVKDYQVSCLFNNGESRIIDFETLFRKWNISKKHIAYPLLVDKAVFQHLELDGGSLVWKNISIPSFDDEGNPVVHYFALDPIVLYENSTRDVSRSIRVGWMIRQARKEQGMTQEQLAQKSGTSKHYISRVENDKSSIEIMTLKKIVEGLGKKLQIVIN